jgi:CubicO group peptidase (beta-lactamase class C family)
MSKSEGESQSLRREPKRISLKWDILIAIASIVCFIVAGLVPVIAHGATVSPPPALLEQIKRITGEDGAPGVTVMVFLRGQLLYRVDQGAIGRDSELPVASASKWVAAALVMSVVDEGKLSLDEPIGKHLPEFTGESGTITLRQILSFTSGQGSLRGLVDVRQDPRISLAESARQIAATPLKDKPGAVFKYGSPAMQVAGALAEQATGETWSHLFDERIARPLGMTHTRWANPVWPNVPSSEIHNPNLQGGLITTADDYGKFLTMLAMDGVFQGRRILSAKAVATMETAQTIGLPKDFEPREVAGAGLEYGLGNWCASVEPGGQCRLVASPGALGTYPWIDRKTGLYGIFFMQRRLPLVGKDIQAASKIIAANAFPRTSQQ